MKLQNLGFFEKHSEKLALGLGAVILLAVGGYYLLGGPFSVRIQGQTADSPTELEQPIRDAAQQLQQRLDEDEPFFEQDQVPQFADAFQQRLAPSEQALAQLEVPFAEPGLAPGVIPEPPDQPYELPRPAFAANLATRSGYAQLGELQNALPDEIDPEQVRSKILQRIGDQTPPYDLHYVSVSGTFNVRQWVEAVQNVSESRRIPEGWIYENITAVYLQRQRRNPATGEWGEPQTVEPMPGQTAYMPDSDREWTSEQAFNARRRIAERQRQIRRPYFVQLQNSAWYPPHLEKPTPEDQQFSQREQEQQRDLSPDEQRRLARSRERVVMVIDLLQRAMERGRPLPSRLAERMQEQWQRSWEQYVNAPGSRYEQAEPFPNVPTEEPMDQRDPRRDRDQPDGMPPEMMEEMMPPGMRRRGSLDTPQTPGQLGPKQVIHAQPASEREMMRQMRQMEQMGGMRGMGGGSRAMSGDWELEDPDNPSAIRVWAHDIAPRPGATYRYRLVVAVLNPLFQRHAVPPEQREEHFHMISLAPSGGGADGWSEPVSVKPDRHFFMIEGQPQRDTATVEVWRLQGGNWHSHAFDVQAGDPIGDVIEIERPEMDGQGRFMRNANRNRDDDEMDRTQRVDMSVNAMMVDVTESAGQGLAGSVTQMLYRPAERSDLLARTLSEDQNHERRIELQNETANIERELALLDQAIREAEEQIRQREEEQQRRDGGGGGSVNFSR
jgi:hypothetical protein